MEKSFADVISETVKKNEAYLRDHVRETFSEVIEFVNDAIDYWKAFSSKSGKESMVKSACANFVFRILMPLSYAVFLDLLAANLVACFAELRMITEGLAKAYLADQLFSEMGFFAERLEALEEERRRKRISTTKLLQNVDRRFVALWDKLSREWLHPTGIVRRLVEVGKEQVPSWSLLVPMPLSQDDMSTLQDLCKAVKDLRELLKEYLPRETPKEPFT